MWLGIDDTDSPEGGCTTWVLTELVRVARSISLDLIGEPRLVRLNPNIPWRTRGNAALAARFGHGMGPRRAIGALDGSPVVSHGRSRPLTAAEGDRLISQAWERVRALAPRVRGTDPALVAAERPLPAELYWRAVREVVPARPLLRELERWGAVYRHRGSSRGLVGAAAALAWPGRRATWELIAYRAAARWGTVRTVDPASVRRAQRRVPELFLCTDPRTRRLLVTPHTGCPILFGLRGTNAAGPLRARSMIRSEPVDRWLLFRTNQATGDHLVRRPADGLAAYESGIVDGTVTADPTVSVGGHVRFEVADRAGAMLPCLAFEPTKTLPRIARQLRGGDRVRVWGSRGVEPGLRLEGLRVVRLAPRFAIAKPFCERCGRPARSLGAVRGFRCAGCHRRWPPEAAGRRSMPAEPLVGDHHPTPSARRHLAPLAPER